MVHAMKMRLAMLTFALSCYQAAAQDMPLSQIVKEGEGWKVLGSVKPPAPLQMGIALDGQGGHVRYSTGLIDGLSTAGPFFGTVPGKRILASIAPVGKMGKATFEVSVSELPLTEPAGVVLWRDGSTLVIADAGAKHLWAFRVANDGSLAAGEKYYPLRVRKGVERSEAGGLTIDGDGRIYAATSEGVQVFDPTGRLCGMLCPPTKGKLTDLFFDSKEADRLCVVCDGKVYGRKLLVKGFFHTVPPMQ
jgi:hypothetical protein